MKTIPVTVVFASLTILLAGAGCAQAETKEISFRNKKNADFNLYCKKNEGKIKTTITCNGPEFTPTSEWEEINAEKVCFQHQDGRIRACDELSKPGGAKKSYACLDVSGKRSPFKPEKGWKMLAGKDTICAEEWNHSDVIRKTDIKMPNLNMD